MSRATFVFEIDEQDRVVLVVTPIGFRAVFTLDETFERFVYDAVRMLNMLRDRAAAKKTEPH